MRQQTLEAVQYCQHQQYEGQKYSLFVVHCQPEDPQVGSI